MEQWQRWFQEKQVERTIEALKRNRFEALYVPDSKSALQEILGWIPDGAVVAVGGSVTLAQMGLIDALAHRKVRFLWPMRHGKTPEEILDLIRASFSADLFLSSANAVTEDGKLFNVDASGNRVGAMFIGPKKAIIVCGVNKIVKDIATAERRLREWTAPQNAKRLGRKTPCAETGVCADCNSPDRICNVYVTLAKRPARIEMTVVLVGEPLGI